MVVPLDAAGLREALEDEKLPKHVHDLKAVLRALEPHGVSLGGVRDDVMLYSYLVNPTHGSHILPDVTARFTDRALAPASKNPTADEIANLLPESANAVHRLSKTLREQSRDRSSQRYLRDDGSSSCACAATHGAGGRSN